MIERPSPNKIQLCHYNGKIRGIASSWAAISTCGSGIDGTLYDGKELHFIGRDKEELDDDKIVSEGVAHVKNAQSRRRSLTVPSRRWNIDWQNNG